MKTQETVSTSMGTVRMLSPAQAAGLLEVSTNLVLKWIRDGKLPANRYGHRTIRLLAHDVDAFMRKGGVPCCEK